MKFAEPLLQIWREDRLLKSVARNSSYLFSSTMLSTVLSSAQVFLATWLLGALEYGMLGIILDFASNVNRLLSFRMGELVVRYAGQALAVEKREEAAAIIKAAGISEAITSVVAYLLLYALAPLAAQHLVQNPAAVDWIRLYGLALLANLMTETSIAVLQVGGHFRRQAGLQLAQSVLSFSLIGAAFLLKGGVQFVLMAYLAGKLLYGLGLMVSAGLRLSQMLGPAWSSASIRSLSNRRELFGFAFSTNLSATINLVVRDSEVLWIALFLSPLHAGYYKLALAVMGLILMPVNSLINTTFPEISKAIARREWGGLRNLLKRTSFIAAAWTGACGLGLLLVGRLFLGWYKGGEYLATYPAALILLIGYGVANVFFWNRPLLLALGKQNTPLVVSAVVGGIKTALMFALVPQFGYLMQAGLLSFYFALSIGSIVWQGLKELRLRESWLPAGETV